MANNDTLDFGFAKARRDFTAALAREGWNIDVLDDPTPGGPKIFLVDDETDYVQLCQAGSQGLTRLAARWRRRRGNLWDGVCDVLGTLLGQLAYQKVPAKSDQVDAAKLACLYTAGTETYGHLVDAGATDGTVIIIRFRHASGEYWLRPAALSRTDVLTPDEVRLFAREVLKIDRVRHPDRFTRAPVVPLNPRA